jgi:transcriptional regulator with XRE-family HTH domain
MPESPSARIAANLRAIRAQRNLPVVTLAKLSGVARATLTKIEAGQGNPTIDTLYALADALGVPLGDLIGEPSSAARLLVLRGGEGTRVSGALSARLLDRMPGRLAEVYDMSFTTKARTADPHPSGTLEAILLTAGKLRVGPATEPVELEAGDYIRFPGDVPHVYQAVDGPAHGVLVMSHP